MTKFIFHTPLLQDTLANNKTLLKRPYLQYEDQVELIAKMPRH
jgi:hypothetical protein